MIEREFVKLSNDNFIFLILSIKNDLFSLGWAIYFQI